MPDANCKICGGTGWKIVERAGLSGAERCECSYAARNLAIKENSRIPLKLSGRRRSTISSCRKIIPWREQRPSAQC